MAWSQKQATDILDRTILYAPFVPFIVIFCHVIETTDLTDLDRLHSFVASLDPAIKLSEATARLQRLFQVLYNVALKYVEIRASREQVSVGREFDTYLNALGFGPGIGGSEIGFGEMSNPGNMTFQGLPTDQNMLTSGPEVFAADEVAMPQQGIMLGEWYYSNQQMLGLLEENSL